MRAIHRPVPALRGALLRVRLVVVPVVPPVRPVRLVVLPVRWAVAPIRLVVPLVPPLVRLVVGWGIPRCVPGGLWR